MECVMANSRSRML